MTEWSDEENARVLRVVNRILIVVGGDCWVWSGCKQIRRPNSRSVASAHRWFYEVLKDPQVPDVLLKDCETENCVNPEHYTGLTWTEFSSGIWERFRETRIRCKHGHELAEVGVDHRGVCRRCLSIQSRRSYLKRKAREAEQNT